VKRVFTPSTDGIQEDRGDTVVRQANARIPNGGFVIESDEHRMTTHRRTYLEIGFKIWKHSQSWLWLVVSPHINGGTIGVAATEAEAILDARSSVEDISAQHGRLRHVCVERMTSAEVSQIPPRELTEFNKTRRCRRQKI
jgi:hypothetical protein